MILVSFQKPSATEDTEITERFVFKKQKKKLMPEESVLIMQD